MRHPRQHAVWTVCPPDRLGITADAIARGRDGRFISAGVCWVAEWSFAWMGAYRRLNDHLIAFVAIAITSIPVRRLRRLVAEDWVA